MTVTLILEHLAALVEADVCATRAKNKPWRTPGERKKFAVCASDGSKTLLVRFGDPELSIKRDQPDRRKNFRARHSCDDDPPSILTPRYWACKTWEKERSVKDVLKKGAGNYRRKRG